MRQLSPSVCITYAHFLKHVKALPFQLASVGLSYFNSFVENVLSAVAREGLTSSKKFVQPLCPTKIFFSVGVQVRRPLTA